ncbi:hypothetical protein B296_00018651 [Ensete ventricosum]|uniref:Uncharacterized protein n=1 Tax=Ensete ventricosum TaxID=4639 RepID=A0A427AQ68_ENSVE|nr:hypothetical protein B296_00018651 [Ensete ventricosum]
MSRPVPPPPPEAPIEVLEERSAHGGEKRPGGGGSEPSKKKTKVAVSKRLRKATLEGTSERAPCGKGKGLAEATESPDCAPTLRDLCEVDDWAGKDLVRLLTGRCSTLRAKNKELKASAGSEAMAAVKKRAIKLSAEVDRLKAALGKTKQCRKGLELAADSTRVELKDLRDSRRRLEDEVLLLTKVAGCCSPS